MSTTEQPARVALRNVARMSDAQLLREAVALKAADEAARYTWECRRIECDGMPHDGLGKHARTNQRWPAGDWDTWLLLAGRGFGKTRTGSEGCKKQGMKRRMHIAVIAKSHREVQNVCYEAADAGLLAVIPPDLVTTRGYRRSSGTVSLTLTNGTIFRAFSAEDPDAIRGYAFDGAWCDEYAAWPKATAQDMLDQLWFCLREATDPFVIITTTPQPQTHVKTLLADANANPAEYIVVRGHTRDNIANLSTKAVKELERRFEGTRLGRQELGGELLDDVEGALLTLDSISAGRRLIGEVPSFASIVVGVDPATTSTAKSDETGIVSSAIGVDNEAYVLGDRSGVYRPPEWGRLVWEEALRVGAHAVVVEDNAGGDMCEHVLAVAWGIIAEGFRKASRTPPARPPIVRVHPSGEGQGKWARALPVAALYDNERVHHVIDERAPDGVNDLTLLQDQLCTWTGDKDDPSPDRVDALVHGISWLMFPARRALKKATHPKRIPASRRWQASGRR